MPAKTVQELRRARMHKMEEAAGSTDVQTIGMAEVSNEDVGRGVSPGPVVATGPHFVKMYEPHTGNLRMIPSHTVLTARLGGLRLECPHCLGDHDDGTPNACPALPPVAYRECTVCKRHGRQKLFWDEAARAEPNESERSEDPLNLTPTEEQSTPEARLRMLWEEHMLVYHPSDARAAGIRPRIQQAG